MWPKLHTLAVILDLKEAYLLPQKVKRKTNTRKRQGNVYSSCHNDFIFFQISPKTRGCSQNSTLLFSINVKIK